MDAVDVLAACAIGAGLAGIASLVRPPTRRLAPRVRPYAVVARTALGHAPEPAHHDAAFASTATMPRLFGPALRSAARRLSERIESRGDDRLRLVLRQAGYDDVSPDEYRVRQLASALGFAFGAGLVVALLLRTPLLALLGAVAGFVYGSTRMRPQDRRARSPSERAGCGSSCTRSTTCSRCTCEPVRARCKPCSGSSTAVTARSSTSSPTSLDLDAQRDG